LKVNKWLLLALIFSLAYKATGPMFTCLDDIQVSPDIKDRTFDYLREYDQNTNRSLFRLGLRPIRVIMGHTDYPILAFAKVGFFSCEVTISNNIEWNKRKEMLLKSTLLHELGHCYLFDHVEDPNDLMYFENSEKITEDTLKKFYIKLNKRAHL